MIEIKGRVFKIETDKTSYIFRITGQGHAEHIYYSAKLPAADVDVLALKNTIALGSAVEYSKDAPGCSLDSMLLEYSGVGKGDYRHTPTEIIMPDGSFVTDFVYGRL